MAAQKSAYTTHADMRHLLLKVFSQNMLPNISLLGNTSMITHVWSMYIQKKKVK